MENELQELIRQNTRLKVRCDASAHDMYYMNLSDKKLMLQKETEEVKNAQNDWDKQHLNFRPLISRLFTDSSFVDKNINV